MSAPSELIRASELGMYAYCAHAWWLQTRCGIASQNVRALASGTHQHLLHGRQVARSHRLRTLGYIMIAMALILLLWGVWLHA